MFFSEQIDDEIPLKIWTKEDHSCGDFSFDIVDNFLSICCPFKPLLPFQQQIDRLHNTCIVRNKPLHKIDLAKND
jgi:hypothetical protein